MKDIIIFDNPIDGLSLYYKGELTVTKKMDSDFLKTTQYTRRIKDGEEGEYNYERVQIKLSPKFTQKYVYTRQTSTTSGADIETISCPCVDHLGRVIGEEEEKTIEDCGRYISTERKVTIESDGKIYKLFSLPNRELIYVLDDGTKEVIEHYDYEDNGDVSSLTTKTKIYTIGKDRKLVIKSNSDDDSEPVLYDSDARPYLNGVEINLPKDLLMAFYAFFPDYSSWTTNNEPPEIGQAIAQHEKEKEEKGRRPY